MICLDSTRARHELEFVPSSSGMESLTIIEFCQLSVGSTETDAHCIGRLAGDEPHHIDLAPARQRSRHKHLDLVKADHLPRWANEERVTIDTADCAIHGRERTAIPQPRSIQD